MPWTKAQSPQHWEPRLSRQPFRAAVRSVTLAWRREHRLPVGASCLEQPSQRRPFHALIRAEIWALRRKSSRRWRPVKRRLASRQWGFRQVWERQFRREERLSLRPLRSLAPRALFSRPRRAAERWHRPSRVLSENRIRASARVVV